MKEILQRVGKETIFISSSSRHCRTSEEQIADKAQVVNRFATRTQGMRYSVLSLVSTASHGQFSCDSSQPRLISRNKIMYVGIHNWISKIVSLALSALT